MLVRVDDPRVIDCIIDGSVLHDISVVQAGFPRFKMFAR